VTAPAVANGCAAGGAPGAEHPARPLPAWRGACSAQAEEAQDEQDDDDEADEPDDAVHASIPLPAPGCPVPDRLAQ
jgi:hypothetical protein